MWGLKLTLVSFVTLGKPLRLSVTWIPNQQSSRESGALQIPFSYQKVYDNSPRLWSKLVKESKQMK